MRAGALVPLLLLLGSAAPGGDSVRDRDAKELIEALGHENPAVRLAAEEELGRRREPAALVPILGRLVTDPEPAVRAHAAEALRRLGDERAVPWLSRALADPDATTRCRAVLALGDLGGKYVLPSVRRMLLDPALVVRAAAVRALGELGDPLSLEAVLEAERSEKEDTDDAVAAAAIVAAAKLGGPAGLARALRIAGDRPEENWFLRAVVAHAIGVAKDSGRVPWLVERLREDVDPRVSEAAAGALAALGEIGPLREAMALAEPVRRRAAVAGIAEAAELPGVREALVAATGDEDPDVVLRAASALVGRGEVEAFPLLFALLEEEAPVWLGALATLESRTGLEFGRNPPRWREWYRARKGKLVFRPETGRYEGVR